MSSQLPEQMAVILLERVGVPLMNRAGAGLWAMLREKLLGGAAPTSATLPTDFTNQVTLRLRETDAIMLDWNSKVPSVSVWFEVINHSDVDLVLDRIVFELRAGQPFFHGLMAHRTLVPARSTVSTIWAYGLLTESAVALIREHQEAARTVGASLQILQVFPRAYFDSPTLRFAIEGRNISRSLPPG